MMSSSSLAVAMFRISVLALSIGVATCTAPGSPERVAAYMEEHAAEISGALLLIRDGNIIFEDGYGLANEERKIPNRPETIYPFGSIVKDYTRFSIVTLAEELALTLDDSLVMFFPDVPDDKRHITVRQLLHHTSGLHAYHGERQDGIPADHLPMSQAEAQAIILGQKLLFEPGTDKRYSNSGYTLLAMIIEQVSGLTYPEFIRTRLLEPAGMVQTDFYGDRHWHPDEVAVGYGPVHFGVENSPVYWPRNAWPVAGNGGMAGSLMDLYKGIKYIYTRREASSRFDEIWRDAMPPDQPVDFYGSAGGNDFGFVTILFYRHDGEKALVMAMNRDDDGVEDPALLMDLLRIGLNEEFNNADNTKDVRNGSSSNELAAQIPTAQNDWGLPDEGTWRRASAVLDVISSGDSTAFRTLVMEAFTPRFANEYSIDEHIEQLRWMHEHLLPVNVTRVERANRVEFLLTLQPEESGQTFQLTVALEEHPPFRIDRIVANAE